MVFYFYITFRQMAKEIKGVKVSKMLLIGYIVVSALFIIMSIVGYLQNAVYNVWVQNWVANAINGVMQKAVDPKCEAFSLFSGDAEVALVNVQCLQQQAPAQNQAPVQAEAPVEEAAQ